MKKFILFLIVIMMFAFVTGCEFLDEKPTVSFIYEEVSKETFSKDESGENNLSSKSVTTSNTQNHTYHEEYDKDRENYPSSTNYDTEHNANTVYKTPTGKRYHFSYICGGENSVEITLEEAISLGLTPCKNCVLKKE